MTDQESELPTVPAEQAFAARFQPPAPPAVDAEDPADLARDATPRREAYEHAARTRRRLLRVQGLGGFAGLATLVAAVPVARAIVPDARLASTEAVLLGTGVLIAAGLTALSGTLALRRSGQPLVLGAALAATLVVVLLAALAGIRDAGAFSVLSGLALLAALGTASARGLARLPRPAETRLFLEPRGPWPRQPDSRRLLSVAVAERVTERRLLTERSRRAARRVRRLAGLVVLLPPIAGVALALDGARETPLPWGTTVDLARAAAIGVTAIAALFAGLWARRRVASLAPFLALLGATVLTAMLLERALATRLSALAALAGGCGVLAGALAFQVRAARLVAELALPEAELHTLVEALSAADVEIAARIREALVALAGTDRGTDAEAWALWLDRTYGPPPA